MRDPELVRNLSARARQRAARLTWPNIVERYREVLQAAIAQRSPATARTIEVPPMSTPQALR
jgi:hypothetical protein